MWLGGTLCLWTNPNMRGFPRHDRCGIAVCKYFGTVVGMFTAGVALTYSMVLHQIPTNSIKNYQTCTFNIIDVHSHMVYFTFMYIQYHSILSYIVYLQLGWFSWHNGDGWLGGTWPSGGQWNVMLNSLRNQAGGNMQRLPSVGDGYQFQWSWIVGYLGSISAKSGGKYQFTIYAEYLLIWISWRVHDIPFHVVWQIGMISTGASFILYGKLWLN